MIKKSPKPKQPTRVILLHKPFNTLCQFTGEAGDSTLADFIDIADIYPAGRLDKDSEGLLLLTNDGQLQQQIANPKHKLEKTYWVQVEGSPQESDLERLRKGLKIQDYTSLPAKARIMDEPAIAPRTPPIRERKNIPTSWLEIKIKQGKNRQVRRMTAAIGFPTLRLIRAQIGDLALGDLQSGEYAQLDSEQLLKLKASFKPISPSAKHHRSRAQKANSRQRFRSPQK